MKYGIQNLITGEIIATYATMADWLKDYPNGFDADNRKFFKIVTLK
jgi:hypothetical protein